MTPRPSDTRGALPAALVLLACFAVVVLPGCTSMRDGFVWWNPTTWASRAAPARVDRAQDNRDEAAEAKRKAEAALIDAAQRETAKTGHALASAPDSKPVRLARRFNANALALMAQVRPLTAEESMQLQGLVADLMSDNEQIARDAELRQIGDEAKAANLSRELTEATTKLERKDAALSAANANLREAYDRENALANQVRNFWFVLGLLAFLWVAGNLLSYAARLSPGLAPIAGFVNGIAAPALAFAEARARAGLTKVGHAMAEARAKLPEAAEVLTHIFDRNTDADHQQAIGAAANTAPRT